MFINYNDSNCLVSVSLSGSNDGAIATITAGTPTTCDSIDSTASVGSYDTVVAVAVSVVSAAGAPMVFDDSDNTASVSTQVAPSA